eukprot:TRINITY_DN5552_c0_g1_i1.p1 TRINITY_DN5552_c0_g1~~TRINITY_DN5552_c0_g1_i1.p1  ORF type:complete len:523 (-),score=176.53 TRINITY_DN5552_c0_g1_i1:280-1848(-)
MKPRLSEQDASDNEPELVVELDARPDGSDFLNGGDSAVSSLDKREREFIGLTRHQWFVLFAAWLGWGFDVFDQVLFTYVAPVCIPQVLGLSPDTTTAKELITFWTASLTSLLLVGWGIGGILFGKLTDIFGRSRMMIATIVLYALSTAICAFATSIWFLAVFRFLAALGIGGEWAAGATLVAEAVPKNRRVVAGALLYTAAPMGHFLATGVNWFFTSALEPVASDASLSWRLVFASALLPLGVTVLIRLKMKESTAWEESRAKAGVGRKPLLAAIKDEAASLRLLFAREQRRNTIGAMSVVLVALVTHWSCSSFVPIVCSFLAGTVTPAPATADLLRQLKARYIAIGTTAFNFGGLLGSMLTIPAATYLGRRWMYVVYFSVGSLFVFLTFSPYVPISPFGHLFMMTSIGTTMFGVFGSFTFYLPELFPIHIRASGCGFTYNVGRFVAAFGPFIVGVIGRRGGNPMEVIQWIMVVPLIGAIAVACKVAPETKFHSAFDAPATAAEKEHERFEAKTQLLQDTDS